MSGLQVVGLGAMNLDRLYSVERILVDGEAPVKRLASHPGGSAANTVYALARLGISTGFVGAVGDDEAGKTLIDDLAAVNVDTSSITVKAGEGTGSTLCLTDEAGSRSIYVMAGANDSLTLADLDMEYLQGAEGLHLSSFVGEAQLQLQQQVAEQLGRSLRITFAPGALYAARGIDMLAPILRNTHVLFVNRAEMEVLASGDFRTGARRCLSLGCQIVVTTLGNASAELVGAEGREPLAGYLLTVQGEHYIRATSAPGQTLADTAGAGDAFAAGFLYGLTLGMDSTDCGTLAEIMARLSVVGVGARQGLPSPEVLAQEYRRCTGKAL